MSAPGDARSSERPTVSATVGILAAAVGVAHTAPLCGCTITPMVVAPRVKQQYADYGMRTPFLTDLAVRLADFAWVAALAGLLFVAADVAVFVFLASHR